jgi:hypothetical protein
MNRPVIELPPQSGHRFIEHLPSLVNHHDVLAHLLGMRHDVGRKEHGRTAPVLRRMCSRRMRTLTGPGR